MRRKQPMLAGKEFDALHPSQLVSVMMGCLTWVETQNNAPGEARTSNLFIPSGALYHCATEPC